MAAPKLSEEDIEEFREAFSLFDKDGTGVISFDDLATILNSIGRRSDLQDLKALAEEVGAASAFDRGIDFQAFLKLVAARLHAMDCVEDMREAFQVFDRDNNGSVSARELKHVMNNLGESVSNEEVEALIREADADGDGELSFDDFLNFVTARGLILPFGESPLHQQQQQQQLRT
mmetsp:Transcript_46531/g.100290  ORF Transcript_46531/g.100290 Transcript_46531/m.100290 type:complete len:175 (+) Transcript_46531:144-668(+)